jgi:hypothetical protein
VIPLTGLAMPHLCACPMPGHGFLILSWSFYAQLFMSGGFYFVGVVDHLSFKVILHQFWVKKIFPWKFNLEYSGTFTKLFMHVSSRNMFPTIRNLQIRVHVYRPCHCCGD